MLNRRFLMSILFGLLLAFSATLVSAQDSLDYGDDADGEVSSDEDQVEFTFEGAEGDVVVITVTPEDEFEGLSDPAIFLLDSSGDDVAEFSTTLGAATLVWELPADDEYSIVVSRIEEGEGEFTISLNLAVELELGETIEATATNEQGTYFVIRPSSSQVNVLYTHNDGDYYPNVSLNVLGEPFLNNSNLESLATASGASLNSLLLGIDTNEDIVIVYVGPGLFNFAFDTEEVEFSLQLIEFE